jgi:hypothetical protein
MDGDGNGGVGWDGAAGQRLALRISLLLPQGFMTLLLWLVLKGDPEVSLQRIFVVSYVPALPVIPDRSRRIRLAAVRQAEAGNSQGRSPAIPLCLSDSVA